MAVIKVRNTKEVIEGHDKVLSFLEKQGVLYEHWDMNKLPEGLREKFDLNDQEKEEILSTFKEDIEELAEEEAIKHGMSSLYQMLRLILMNCLRSSRMFTFIRKMKYVQSLLVMVFLLSRAMSKQAILM